MRCIAISGVFSLMVRNLGILKSSFSLPIRSDQYSTGPSDVNRIAKAIISIGINRKIELTEELVKKLNEEENYLSKLIYKTEQRIVKKEEELFILQNQLNNRVKYLYKHGRNNILKEIIETDKWGDYIKRVKYLEILNTYENEIKERINKSLNNLKKEKSNLSKEKNLY